jgi:hypothetical protein
MPIRVALRMLRMPSTAEEISDALHVGASTANATAPFGREWSLPATHDKHGQLTRDYRAFGHDGDGRPATAFAVRSTADVGSCS